MENEVNAPNENDAESSDSNEFNESADNQNDVHTTHTDNENENENYENDSENENENHNLLDVNINENDEEISSTSQQAHNFDLNLPASHSYLGANLEELRGRTVLDEGIYMKLPLLKRSMVLFPGQTLPMAVFGTNVIEMLLKCIQKNRTFGVVCIQNGKYVPIGTTAEIYEYRHGNAEGGFRIKAKGRQRFKILRIIQGYHDISANVKIEPEITLSHPYFQHRLTSLDHQRVKPINEEDKKKQDRIEMLEASLTYWPAWVYRQYDPYKLSNKIRQHLHFIETRGSCIPSDPIELSFWVAQNLPLNENERILLLKYDCAISRLQWELKYLTKDRVFVCNNCQKLIGKQSDIFPMSKEGPQSTFCNSGGFLHDTVTLYRAENLKLNSESPTTIYSWFPGYAWTIATCKGCGSHMGWKFTADNDKTLRPASFWGLTRRGLTSKKCDGSNDSDSENEHNVATN